MRQRRHGPPKQYPHDIHIRLRTEELDALKAEADYQEVSVSDIIRQCIQEIFGIEPEEKSA